MKRFISLFITAVLLLAVVGTASAVDFQEELKKMATENAKGYIGPFSTAFGTAMNSGLYHTAKPHGMLGFDISFKFAVVTVPDDAQTFDFLMPTVSVPDPLNPGQTIDLDGNILFPDRENPTVFGEDEVDPFSITAESVRAAFEYVLVDIDSIMTQDEFNLWATGINWDDQLNAIPTMPRFPGIGFNALPLFMPQVSVGLIKKTEVMLRFMPKVKLNDDIDAGFIGIGIKHNLDQWLPIPLFPIDISAQYVWQSLTIGDLLKSGHSSFTVMASKKIGIGVSITPYIGMGFESSTLDVSYTIENPSNNPMLPADGTEIDFSLDGDNSFRMTGGVRFGLPFITLNADYSIGEYKTYSLGFGFSLR
ncbi:hypothetical protein HQ587_03315 [bacterium]|nr:hypothetical protein [bacterium]